MAWPVPHGPKAFAVAVGGHKVRGFSGRKTGSVPERVVFRAAILLSLIAYARRVHPSGRALCLLWLRPLRVLVAMMGLILLVCTAGAVYYILGVAISAVMAAALLPFAIGAVRARPGRKDWPSSRRRAGMFMCTRSPVSCLARVHNCCVG